MKLSSIQVSEATRKRLERYKVAGMTYEDVLLRLMTLVSPREFHALQVATPAEDVPPRRGRPRRKRAPRGPEGAVENMEKAYRLFALTREGA